jgi:hypothetical protein
VLVNDESRNGRVKMNAESGYEPVMRNVESKNERV